MSKLNSGGRLSRRRCRTSPNCLVESLEARQLLSLIIDMRLAPELGGGKSLTVSSLGQEIHLEAWAVVTGSNGSGGDERLQTVVGSFLSPNSVGGGAVLGSMRAAPLAPFDGLASDNGTSVDLDGDGDLDVGSNVDANVSAAGFFVARASSIQTSGTVVGASKQFKIGDVYFTVTGALAGGQTEVNFRPANAWFAGIWAEDLTPVNAGTATIGAGTPVVLSAPNPPAAQFDTGTGLLTVSGTTAADTISVTSSGGTVTVVRNGGAPQSFGAADVRKIIVTGGDGSDTITIGSGVMAVSVSGNRGDDTIIGGDGKDTVIGGGGNDSISGGRGGDSIRGGAGNDILLGQDGWDVLLGAADNDIIRGGKGNDTIDGGVGNDQLFGGEHDDTFYARDNWADVIDGGIGTNHGVFDNLDTLLRVS